MIKHAAISLGIELKLGLALSLGALGSGCATTHAAAVQYFAATMSCPESAMTVADAVAPLPPDLPLPDEVRRDPARYQVWLHTRDVVREAASNVDWRFDFYDVAGCGHRVLLRCADPSHGKPSCEPNDGGSVADLIAPMMLPAQPQ